MTIPTYLPHTSLWSRLSRGVRKVWHRPDWIRHVGPDWPSRIMDVVLTDDFHAKQGRSTARWLLEQNGAQLGVYLKRHYHLPWWRGLLASLWPTRAWSPAWQEYGHLLRARELGLSVPAPVAAGEYIGPWGKLQSILAVEELTGMLALHQAIPLAQSQLDSVSFRRWKAELAVELARLVKLLHERRYFHKDLYLCHFFVEREDTGRLVDWHGRVSVIDFHRLAQHPFAWPYFRVKDLAQFLYSSEMPELDVRDRLAFWRAYAGKWQARSLLAWMVRFKGGRYLGHNEKQKTKALAVSSER